MFAEAVYKETCGVPGKFEVDGFLDLDGGGFQYLYGVAGDDGKGVADQEAGGDKFQELALARGQAFQDIQAREVA